MANVKFSQWITENHPRFRNLTEAAELITKSLLKDANVSYLTVAGRTKTPEDCIEKVRRKRYRNPIQQMTDISGIRIIVFFDYDVQAVSELIEANFHVDEENSSNRDEILSVNEVGYRSVHYVCELGADRTKLREHRALSGLKFEFQVRTVLQHAWAELAHDRNYKFSGQLPKQIERKLFLLAGLMETADNGFSDLSREVDAYISQVSQSTEVGRLDIEVNSITVEEFVKRWGLSENVTIEDVRNRDGFNDLLRELTEYGITTVDKLSKIVPKDFAKRGQVATGTVLGLVRDWMIIADPFHFIANVKVDWDLRRSDIERYERFLNLDQISVLENSFAVLDDDEDDEEVSGWFKLQSREDPS